MSEQGTATPKVTFEEIIQWAQQLSPAEQARLVAQLAPRIEGYLNSIEPVVSELATSSPQLSRGEKMAATLQKIAETSGSIKLRSRRLA